MTPAHKMSFWKTAAIYGFPAGLGIITLMFVNYEVNGLHSGNGSMVFGFLVMFAILSLIFFGIRRFRDIAQGGVIKFSKALLLGLAMSLFASVAYILISEIYLAINNYEFIDVYSNHLIELEKAKGVVGEELATFTDKTKKFADSYIANPLFRIGITFTEIFPMGFIVSIVSALFLHNPKLWARKVG